MQAMRRRQTVLQLELVELLLWHLLTLRLRTQLLCNNIVSDSEMTILFLFDVIYKIIYLKNLQAIYYPRDAMLARVFAIATCLSVCPSVRPSVCHTPVLCLAERKQDREMYTIW